ncbi:MAG: orotidine-5'-phosphate decarboxylase [Flavobacteriaceae bacterium]|jgi:orotidine-5'-phosphate decarboxylase|nr:orotidine-5'-phosphate decarboxylase [Flavobacteriaceae bacterium]
MTQENLFEQIKIKQSFLCVGLDIDLEKIPPHLRKLDDPIFSFAKEIIDATSAYAVAYKPNLAFFETYGLLGWNAFDKITTYLNKYYPNHFIIADAKRGDIGNTATRYAKAFFETYDVDAVTVAPYMGKDAVEPFLAFDNKYAILLTLTSNSGASDFQFTESEGDKLYERILRTSRSWTGAEQLMYVVGATKATALTAIRKIIPNAFLLVPGVGAQGGNLEAVAKAGLNEQCGLLVNSSRGIIYRAQNENFADAAKNEAKKLQEEMALYLTQKGIL